MAAFFAFSSDTLVPIGVAYVLGGDGFAAGVV